jgi:GH18 family chitinase
LKTKNPHVKLLAAVGGYNLDLVPLWYTLAESPTSRLNFARNVRAFLQKTKLDGIGELELVFFRH